MSQDLHRPLVLLTQVQAAVMQLQSALHELLPQKLEPALLQVQQARAHRTSKRSMR